MQQKDYTNVICKKDMFNDGKCVFTKDKMYSGKTMINKDYDAKSFIRSILISDNCGHKWRFNMHRIENGIPTDVNTKNGFGQFFYSKEEWRIKQVEKII